MSVPFSQVSVDSYQEMQKRLKTQMTLKKFLPLFFSFCFVCLLSLVFLLISDIRQLISVLAFAFALQSFTEIRYLLLPLLSSSNFLLSTAFLTRKKL